MINSTTTPQPSLEALYKTLESHRPAINSFLRSRLSRREDSEDATQETLYRAFKLLPDFEVREDLNGLKAWALAIANNVAREIIAKRSSKELLYDANVILEIHDEEREEEALEGALERSAMEDLEEDLTFAIASTDELRPRELRAILGRANGKEFGQIAQEMGVSEASVRSYLSLAIKRIKEHL